MSSLAQTINGATTGNPVLTSATALSRGSGSQLDQAAFLRLMTAQVSAQDPFKPLDQTQMLAQLAQFSQVAGTAEMNVNLGQLVEQVRAQGVLLADIRTALTPPTVTTPSPITGA